jgi:hypothetical protein
MNNLYPLDMGFKFDVNSSVSIVILYDLTVGEWIGEEWETYYHRVFSDKDIAMEAYTNILKKYPKRDVSKETKAVYAIKIDSEYYKMDKYHGIYNVNDEDSLKLTIS